MRNSLLLGTVLFLSACTGYVTPDSLENALRTCDKNGGVDRVSVIYHNDADHILNKVYCKDGAVFDSHTFNKVNNDD